MLPKRRDSVFAPSEGFAHMLLLIIVFFFIVGVIVVVTQKNTLSHFLGKSSPTPIPMKTEYQNPFDTSASPSPVSGTNPFSESTSTNPFDNLQ